MMIMGPRAGLYLGDDQITVVIAGRGGAQHIALEPGEMPGVRLKSELDARQLRLRRIRVGLARPLATVKALELPRADGSQAGDMVAFELERHVPFPPDDIRFDWAPLASESKESSRVLVVACERRIVDGVLRLLEEPRLKPAAITVACHDLPALLGRGRGTRTITWVHRAGSSIDLVCLAQGQLQMSRTLPAGDAGELAEQVSATHALLGWTDCDAVWVSGDRAGELLATPGLADLAAEVSAPPWSPAAQSLLMGLPEEDLGRATLALAVALGSRRPPLNLLAPELRPRTVSAGQLVTAGMLLLTACAGLSLTVNQGYKQHRYAARLSEAIRQLDPEVKTVEQLSAELARKRRLLDTIQSLDRVQARPLPVMRELTERLPQDAWLRTLSMDKQGLEITGQAAAANQLIPLLENSPSLARVEFTAPVTKAGDKEQFRIKAAWKTPAPTEPPPAAPAKPAAPVGRGPAPRPGSAGPTGRER
jgi:general secretion pathway protein L